MDYYYYYYYYYHIRLRQVIDCSTAVQQSVHHCSAEA